MWAAKLGVYTPAKKCVQLSRVSHHRHKCLQCSAALESQIRICVCAASWCQEGRQGSCSHKVDMSCLPVLKLSMRLKGHAAGLAVWLHSSAANA